MTIHYIGLSCFLIENEKKFRILVDPFNNAPEWSLGPKFPKEFEEKPFGANIVLSSEPDADHAYAPGGWLQHAPPTAPHSDPFPGLDLRGTVIHEYNGDVNIAWHYTVEGVRLAHFADHAHILTPQQCEEIGHPDIIFLPMPKADSRSLGILDKVKKNIELLKPKLVVCAHHIAPADLPHADDPETLRNYFKMYFKQHASTNASYQGEKSFIELCYVLENAYLLTKEFPHLLPDNPTLKITPGLLTRDKDSPIVILFRSMLATS